MPRPLKKALLTLIGSLLLAPCLGAAQLTLRVDDIDALPGETVQLEIRTYSPRPVGQGQICLSTRRKAGRAALRGALSSAAGTNVSPFAALLGGRVFSEANDTVSELRTEIRNGETLLVVDFISPSGTINATDGPMIQLDLQLRSDLLLGDEFEVFVDLANTLVLDPSATPLDLRTEPGRLRIRADDDSPGALGFTQVSFQATEASGAAIVTVERTDGDSGGVSVSYSTRSGSADAADYVDSSGTLTWADKDTGLRSFRVDLRSDDLREPSETVQLVLSDPAGGADLTRSSATLEIGDTPPTAKAETVSLRSATISALESDPTAQLVLQRAGDLTLARTVTVSTRDGSAVAGSDYGSLRETVFWPPGDGSPRVLQLALLNDLAQEGNESFDVLIDASPLAGTSATVTIIDDDTPALSCTETPTQLCLTGGRFRVDVGWHLANGTTGRGTAAPLSESSGTFWFFDAGNVELLVKVLDACTFPGLEAYWVFFAATTDVGFSLEVTDTAFGISRQYVNVPGSPASPVQDTQTFLACP